MQWYDRGELDTTSCSHCQHQVVQGTNTARQNRYWTKHSVHVCTYLSACLPLCFTKWGLMLSGYSYFWWWVVTHTSTFASAVLEAWLSENGAIDLVHVYCIFMVGNSNKQWPACDLRIGSNVLMFSYVYRPVCSSYSSHWEAIQVLHCWHLQRFSFCVCVCV